MHLNRKVNRPLVGRCAQDPVEAQGLTAVQPLVAADGFAVRRAYMLTSSFVAAKLPLWVGTESSRTIEAATQAAHTPNRNVGQLCFLQLPFTPATAAGSNVCLLVAIAIWSVECDRLVPLQRSHLPDYDSLRLVTNSYGSRCWRQLRATIVLCAHGSCH